MALESLLYGRFTTASDVYVFCVHILLYLKHFPVAWASRKSDNTLCVPE